MTATPHRRFPSSAYRHVASRRGLPKGRRAGILRVVRRNSRWIVLIGSVLVTCALTARDYYREKREGFIHTIQEAENFSELAMMERLTNESASRTERIVSRAFKASDVQAASSSTPITPYWSPDYWTADPWSDITPEFARLRAITQITDSKLQILERLMELNGNPRSDAHSFIDGMEREDEKNAFALGTDWERPIPLGAAKNTPHDYVREPSPEISKKIEDLNEKIDKLRNDNIFQLNAEVDETTHLYVFYTWIAYSIIALGIAISLTGQLAGKPDGPLEINL